MGRFVIGREAAETAVVRVRVVFGVHRWLCASADGAAVLPLQRFDYDVYFGYTSVSVCCVTL